MIEGIVGIGAINDFAQKGQRRVFIQVILFENGLEGTLFALMPQLGTRCIERRCLQTRGFSHHLIRCNKEKLGLLVHELLD